MKKSKVKNKNSKKVTKEKKCADVSTSNASSSSQTTMKTLPVVPTRYDVRPGTIDFGKDYEFQIAALLALKCSEKSTRDMWLGMNLEESGDFDDIVLYRRAQDGKEFLYMIQLKFNMKSEDISPGDFKKEKGNFSLKKYMKSISNMDKNMNSGSEVASEIIDYFKQKQDKIVFVIFTNRPMEDQSLCNNVNIADWMHNVILTGGKAFKFDYSKFNLSVESTVEKYIQNLFLLTEQIHIKDLSAVITKEIGKLTQPLKLTTGRLNKVVDNFILFITDWSKGRLGGHYPITKDHVWKVLLEQVFTPYMINLDKMKGIGMFENKLWMQIIEDKDITVIRADDLVSEFLYNYIRSEIKRNCADYKKLRGSKRDDIAKQIFQVVTKSKEVESDIYEFLWKSRQLPLVLKVDEFEELEIILQQLERFGGLFRIIILTQSVSAFSRTTTLKTFTTIKDLTVNQRTEILEHSVKLQGRTFVKLADLITVDTHCHLTVEKVIKTISGNFTIGNLPPCLPHTFVDRSLEKVWLKNEVLQETSDNVFLIKCNLLNDFEFFVQTNKLKTKESKIYKWPKLESDFDSLNNIDIILFENECNLNKIRSLDFLKSRNVHYLSLHATQSLEWIASFGSTKNIRKFRENSNSCYLLDTINMNDLIEATRYRNFQLPKLITGCPGMGKSFLMDYISARASMDMWILKINLPDHSDYYKNVKFENTSSAELEHLLYFCNKALPQNDNDNITREVFKQYLDNKKIFLIMDAFDEVPIRFQNNAKKIIKSIDDAGFPLCITTRPFLKTELEELLDTFAVTIKPFSQIDQTTYLIKHFSKFVKVSENNELLNVFVHKLLEVAKKSINNQDLEFTGVPLLMTLLAEVFLDDCLNFIISRRFTTEYFDLLNLYRYFIDKKAKIACEKFGPITFDISDLYKSHKTYYALQLLFSEDDLRPLNIKELLEHQIRVHPNTLRLMQLDGIVVPQNNTHVIFVHRSFAEVLVAEWLFENVNTEYREIVKNLVKKTFEPNFAFIRNMFDRMLAIDCPLHLAVINLDVVQVKEILFSKPHELNKNDEAGRSVLHLIASWGVYHPVKTKPGEVNSLKETISKDRAQYMLELLPSDSIPNNKDTFLEFTPLDYAIFSSSLNVANAICRKVKCLNHHISISDFDFSYVLFYLNKFHYGLLASVLIRQSVLKDSNSFLQKVKIQNECENNLHSAVRSRNLNKVTTLISCRHDINQTDETGSTPMHIAVILEDVDLVNLLLANEPNLNIKDLSGKTPLHWAAIIQNKHIIHLLLSYSPDIKISDNMGMTALHYSVLANTNNDDVILRAFIEITYIFSTMVIQDVYGKTALHYALHFDQTENLKLLLKYGTCINVTNTKPTELTNNELELHHSEQAVELLSCTDTDGATVFHWAADKGQVDILNLFLDYGANIDQKDNDGRTALISSAEKGLSDVVQLLLEREADIEAQNQDGRTALMGAALHGNIYTVYLLLNKHAAIEAKDNEGNTSLLCAAFSGYTNVVQLLLERGANIEAQNQDGRTALMGASGNGYTDTVQLLLNERAAIEAKDNEGSTSLLCAAFYGYTNVVQLLLERGANIKAQNQDGRTALMAASRNKHTDTVHLLLNKHAAIEAKDNKGKTSLFWAANYGHTNVVQLLLERGANIEAQYQHGDTALMHASANGHTETVQLLLNKHATIEANDSDGNTSLYRAAVEGHTNVVQLLVERGANIEAQDQHGRTALMRASANGHTEVVQLLLNKHATIEANDNDGITSLIGAAYNGHTNVVQLLLEREANIEARNQDGITALMCASQNGHTDTVQLLLNKHATIEASDNEGATSLFLAAYNGHTNVVQLLLEREANIEAQNHNGRTALMSASANGHTETVRLLLNKHALIEASDNVGVTSFLCASFSGHTTVVQLLLDKGANIEAQNQNGITALMAASGNGRTETVQLLLNKHATIEANDSDGNTSLFWAVHYGHTNVVQLLIERGANIEAQDQHGRTALMYASQNGHTDTVQLLLNERAAIEVNDNKGATSLYLAACKGHTNVVQLLLEREANIEDQNQDGRTALMGASLNGNTEIVQLLLNKHALIEVSDNEGATSLFLAACNGHTNVVQLLLEREANIEAQNQYGRTALMNASHNGHTDTVQLLLNKHALIEASYNDGVTSLLWAAFNGHTNVVQLLLERGANIEAKDQHGRTALMYASQNGHTDTVQLLLNERAAIEANDNKGATSWFLAVHNGHTNVVQLLLEREVNLEARDLDGRTALMRASKNGNIELVQLLLSKNALVEASDNDGVSSFLWAAYNGHTNVVQLLVERGANIEAQDQHGRTALMYASQNGYTDTVQLLLNERAAIEANDNRGATSLLCAAFNGHTNVVQLLLERGANIEAQDQNGITALMVASGNGRTDTVHLLLNNQAAIEAKENEGATALYLAAAMGHIDIVKMLISRGADPECKCNHGKTALMVASEAKHTAVEYLLSSKIK